MNEELRNARVRAELTQEEVAKRSGISLRGYQNYELGERIPNVIVGQIIAEVLQTKVDVLFPIYKNTKKPDGNQAETNTIKG